MGKIKNRDKKRTAARIFTSGGAGNGKSEPLPDKKEQKHPCPHCDRIFAQVFGKLVSSLQAFFRKVV